MKTPITICMFCKRRKIRASVFHDARWEKDDNPNRTELVSHVTCPDCIAAGCWPELMEEQPKGPLEDLMDIARLHTMERPSSQGRLVYGENEQQTKQGGGTMNEPMKPGDRIEIFHDPLTKRNLEGIATLEEFDQAKNGLEKWQVRFDEDEPGCTHTRFIQSEES